MTDKSPLFISANELLAHSIELYTQGNERKYKFVILHLANAVELILKDRIIDIGKSIYREKKMIQLEFGRLLQSLKKLKKYQNAQL